MSDEKTGQSGPPDGAGDEDQTVRVRVQVPPPTEEEEIDSDITTNIRLSDIQKAGIKPPQPKTVQPVQQQIQQTVATQEEYAPAVPASNIAVAAMVGLVAGGALGFLIDKLTANPGVPWGLIVGLIVGAGAGAAFAMRKP